MSTPHDQFESAISNPPPESSKAAIQFRDVGIRIDNGKPLVEGLSFEVLRGETLVLLGRSGSGKTTTLKLINHLLQPTEGEIQVEGKPTSGWDPIELRRHIGYVIQETGLFPHCTVQRNIGVVPRLKGWPEEKTQARVRELLDLVGLDAARFEHRYPRELSGGQRQRVGVARALAADPPVLLMDEPFSAVDPVVRESLQDELLKLQAELGKTIVFVTHDIDEAVKLGDRVAVFRVGGKLAQYDEPGVLLTRPADDFVDSFVGRDRGYRGLGFRSSAALTLGELPTVALGKQASSDAGWLLVVDDEGRPQGWLNTAESTPDAPVSHEHLVPGGSLYDVGSGSLRSALDAALSSPSGQGVAVDGDGRVVGSVVADDVLAALATVRRDEAA